MNAGVRPGHKIWPLILMLGALLSGCDQEKPPALIKSAKEFIVKRDYSTASIQLKNALQQKEDGETRDLLASSMIEWGERVAAEADIDIDKQKAMRK